MAAQLKLNLGCGRRPLPGYMNIDRVALPGVDCIVDFEEGALPFCDDSVGEIVGIDVLEHIRRPLLLLQELHRVAQAGAIATFQVPYGGSDMAWEDPTHTRPWFVRSWGYFSQPYYWRADYGYQGDWQVVAVQLRLTGYSQAGTAEAARHELATLRNIADLMVATLRCVKPIRKPLRELQDCPELRFLRGRG